ncbi:MAG: TIGR04282 family arsenosugar biosynthesis glycosyltransferase [Reyranella sp.]|uniref:TIGR04282 family arsenosugar biosynthesis glycosyltransferase n=1 Tax=Reyranella sp. TaxID=1929291 RepID=UPI001AD2E9C9|nr:TIGR04282 family arsenosugar biosynthesis glycosyltransferase [Reyranella sp.]MBN9086742.1 TIGR04282 family arsenosugar biosynthesis glycosyltransferase [Reyranella sp.]
MHQEQHLVIFSRHPRLGTGKRRLAKDIGAVGALRFQRLMVSLILRRLGRDRRWTTWLGITPDRSGPWPHGFHIVPQGRGDLGRRMASVVRRLPPGPVVIVGSDIPGIAAADIADAFRALGSKDAVFGPATDGGYWLVGLRRRPHFIDPFANVRWSSEHALADTVANLADKEVAMLRPLSDVDDGASWRRHALREVPP